MNKLANRVESALTRIQGGVLESAPMRGRVKVVPRYSSVVWCGTRKRRM